MAPLWTDQLSAWAALAQALIAAISAILIIGTLRQGSTALRHQNKSSDIQSVLTIWERLDHHWSRFKKASGEDERKFEFGQLAGYYEMACSLFRDGVLSTEAARTLREHLTEILPLMRSHPQFDALFKELQSSDETFANIRWFCSERQATSKPSLLRSLLRRAQSVD